MKINMKMRTNLHFKYSVMELMEDTERNDLKALITQYNDGKILDSRVNDLLSKYGLVSGSALTEKGKILMKEGIVQLPEYGTYHIAYVNSLIIGEQSNEGVVAIKRSTCADGDMVDNKKNTVELNCYDADRKMYVFANGNVYRTKNVLNISKSQIEYVYNSHTGKAECIVNASIKWSDRDIGITKVSCKRSPKTKPDDIVRALDDNYDPEYKAIMIADRTGFKDGDLLSMKVDINSKPMFLQCLQEQFETCEVTDIPLMTKNKGILSDWMKLLRKKYWGDKYVTTSESESDQLKWVERIYGGEMEDEILSGEDLLASIVNTKAFWNISAPIDLCPSNSQYRLTFKTVKGDVEDLFRKNIFTEQIMQELEAVYFSDRYTVSSTPEVLRHLVGDAVRIVFVIPKKNGEFSTSMDLSNLPDKCRYIEDTRDWIDTHSRVLIMKVKKKLLAWTMENSLDHFYVEGGRLMCKSKFKVSPESTIDEELIEVIKGGSA